MATQLLKNGFPAGTAHAAMAEILAVMPWHAAFQSTIALARTDVLGFEPLINSPGR